MEEKRRRLSELKDILCGIVLFPIIICGMIKAACQEDEDEFVRPSKINSQKQVRRSSGQVKQRF